MNMPDVEEELLDLEVKRLLSLNMNDLEKELKRKIRKEYFIKSIPTIPINDKITVNIINLNQKFALMESRLTRYKTEMIEKFNNFEIRYKYIEEMLHEVKP